MKIEKIKENYFDQPGMDDTNDMNDTDFEDDETEPVEVELIAAEPTKITGVDGSIVLVSTGDAITVSTESKKARKTLK